MPRISSERNAQGSLVDRLLQILGERLGARDARRAIDAPDFNSYLYARLGEVGLSTIMGDFLNPAGSHGQGSAFMAQLLILKRASYQGTRFNPPVKAVSGSRYDVDTLWMPQNAHRQLYCLTQEAS